MFGCASFVWAQTTGGTAPPATGASGGTGAASGAVAGGSAGSNLTGGVGGANPAQTQTGGATQSGVTAGGQATVAPSTTPVQPGQLPGHPGTATGSVKSGADNNTSLPGSTANSTINAGTTAAQGTAGGITSQSRMPAGSAGITARTGAAAQTGATGSAALGFSFTPGGNGLRIGSIATGGAAQNAGLQLNDDIVSINGRAVNSEAELVQLLQQAGVSPIALGVRRNGQLRMLTMSQTAAATGVGATGVGATTGFGANSGIGVAGQAAINPFRTSVPAAAGTVNANAALTGDFATDFSSWGLEMGTALQRQQSEFQNQINQLSQLNNRINALRMNMMNSTGNSANNVQILEQLRRLRADVGALSEQSSGEFQVTLNAMRDRLNRLNPGGAQSGTIPATASGSSSINAAGSASTPATTLPR
jgi:membrane-associated protease RseP (regulator of RpoE activity)